MLGTSPLIAPVPGLMIWTLVTFGITFWVLKRYAFGPIQAAIDRNLALAQALRINGTPGFVMGDQILRGATDIDTLKAMIRTEREHRQ